MLILPYQTRFTLRSAPLATLALILICTVVYFVAQARDERAYQRSLAYYEKSDLPRIELPRYRAWLARQSPSAEDVERLDELQTALRAHDVEYALALMQDDGDFMDAMHDLRVVTPADPEFLTWRDQRNRFESLQQRSTAERFALARGAAQPWRFVTYQFLHADLGHWLGNMIVLLLAGSFAEPALGRARFLAGFLLSGVAAGALHLSLSDLPVIGASGAIAGAMAMVAVRYGRQRVPVFLSVLFYFDTVRMPALWLLPIWIANELWQWAVSGEGAIAYAAHLGGFVFGAAFAWLTGRGRAHPMPPAPPTEGGDEPRTRLQLQRRAELAAAQLDIAQATRLYGELVRQYPARLEYALARFNVAALGDDQATLREAAEPLLSAPPQPVPAELKRAWRLMAQEKTRAALPLGATLRLARRLVEAREDATVLQLVDALLADAGMGPERSRALAAGVQALGELYAGQGLTSQADALRQRLIDRFDTLDAEPSAAAAAQSGGPIPSTSTLDRPPAGDKLSR